MINFIGTAQKGHEALLYYHYSNGKLNFCKFATSENGLEFNGDSKYVIFRNKKRELLNYDLKNLRISKQGKKYILLYKQNGKQGKTKIAFSSELTNFDQKTELNNIFETATIVPDFKFNNKYVMFFGEKTIKIAFSLDLLSWKQDASLVLDGRRDRFDQGDIEVGNIYMIEKGVFLTYYVKKKIENGYKYLVGACLFDKHDPAKILWRSDEPLWEQDNLTEGEKISPLGSILVEKKLIFYWLVGNNSIYAATCHIPDFVDDLEAKKYSNIVKKYHKNPILAPRPEIHWDSRASFNSAAVYEGGKVHFLYRALGDRDLSVIGYASSHDGVTIDERSDEPAYFPRESFETPGGSAYAKFADHFVSGGGYGGIEDPRLTRVEDKFYLTYVAFDGANPPRAAVSSIGVDDFLNKKWNKWAKAKLISAPGMVNKSAVIFPKKVNGKYVVLHRVYPNILVDFLDDLEFDEYLKGHHFIPPRRKFWDSKKVGAGAPPMLTKDGWLLIYQSVGYQDPSRYKIGAMMLDYDNPSRVLYRTHEPIIEPDQDYENNGFKSGVVYPCGAVMMNDRLNIYYGGSDSVVCSASADVNQFLNKMKNKQEPKLEKARGSVFS